MAHIYLLSDSKMPWSQTAKSNLELGNLSSAPYVGELLYISIILKQNAYNHNTYEEHRHSVRNCFVKLTLTFTKQTVAIK